MFECQKTIIAAVGAETTMKKIISWIIRNVPRKYLQRIAGGGLKLLGIFYRGNAVICPVCEHGYRKFLPYGRKNPRPNALCPHCMSLERHRLIWKYLTDRTDFFRRKQHVLHIAPEACFIERFQITHGDSYITADIESPLAKVKMDIHKIPFASDSFDVVLCNHVLEHVKNDIVAMKEICRVLKHDGYAILQVPFFNPVPDQTIEDPSVEDPLERERLYGQDDHVRRYGKDYPERIFSAGLTPEAENFIDSFSDDQRRRYGLAKGETLFIGRKSQNSVDS